MAETNASRLETYSKLVQVVSVLIGVVISVITVGITLQKEANARRTEAETRRLELEKYANQRRDEATAKKLEAAKPFLELRQTYYLEAIKAAAILASPNDHTQEDLREAKKRFWELYWAELALVEGVDVESTMKALGDALEPELNPTPQQRVTLKLAHALRDSLLQSWGIDETVTGAIRR